MARVHLQAGACASSRGAERALTQAQLVDLPNTGAFVLPLAAHSFLVGLLVIEQIALAPHLPSAHPKLAIQPLQRDQTAAAATGTHCLHLCIQANFPAHCVGTLTVFIFTSVECKPQTPCPQELT